eukprot:CAMPEP_0203817026 /NCGR_PEP_ID=MMETSP0115-20131106/18280_1 /ASSEMBLY_ACC=CAM_ASM_000227 /TAXON_ID=33651 /ORGANISM="Bicosoecid sp, Strain ms1" /LENGTH=228 /DNA_ID=CAMNT_0050725941 /DNA_START=55 /DNA_END=738 /DNA_ORIENTATION=+
MADGEGPSIDDVLALKAPTPSFLCPLSANTYDIVFKEFEVSDYGSKRVIFRVGGDDSGAPPPDFDYGADFDEDQLRTIKYDFSTDILRLPVIATKLIFSVGDQEVRDFLMVERHYFRDRLIKSFEFSFPFCIPNTTNTWEAVYDVPPLDKDLTMDIVKSPYEVVSDSFYFVEGKLIMHNKALYRYFVPDDDEATLVATSTRDAPASGGGAGGGGGGESEGKAAEGKEE